MKKRKSKSNDSSVKKKPNIEAEPITISEAIDFKKLKLDQVIDESALTKYITFKGEYKGQTAVIRLDKIPFDEDSAREAINDANLEAERNLNNDVYSRYKLRPPSNGVGDLKAIVVVPASETVLGKYSREETLLFYESKCFYEKIVEKFIHETVIKNKDYNQWVYNILDGKTEQEHVLFNDPDPVSGFVLLPSLKSSGDEKEIHYLALCHRRDIYSLRDLNANHLPLLQNILTKGHTELNRKFKHIKEGQIRSYIHYHPTFYHFHVHFQHVDPAEYKATDRDNMLIDVIENIEIKSNYYRERTLAFPLSKGTPVWKYIDGKKIIGEIYPRYLGPPSS